MQTIRDNMKRTIFFMLFTIAVALATFADENPNPSDQDAPYAGINIECPDIADKGTGSSYVAHTFCLAKTSDNISRYEWTFMLRDISGNYVRVSTGNAPQFTIDKISNHSNYHISSNGELEGRIECRYTENGKETDAIPFHFSLGLKPIIISIDNVEVNRFENNSFTVSLDVEYDGADYIFLEVEEEYSSSLRNYMFEQPYLAHMTSGKISSLYYSWVTVLVTNEYGRAEHTIEFEPTYCAGIEDNVSTLVNDNDKIQIFRLDGIMVFDGDRKSLTSAIIPAGTYIVRELKENGAIETAKRIIGQNIK